MTPEVTALTLIVVFLCLIVVYILKSSKDREQDLVAALMAKNLSEYALANTEMKTSMKDKVKKMKAENELAVMNEQFLAEERRKEGVPVT
jgi:hypothetical protein